jgi:hypothetical protein
MSAGGGNYDEDTIKKPRKEKHNNGKAGVYICYANFGLSIIFLS